MHKRRLCQKKSKNEIEIQVEKEQCHRNRCFWIVISPLLWFENDDLWHFQYIIFVKHSFFIPTVFSLVSHWKCLHISGFFRLMLTKYILYVRFLSSVFRCAIFVQPTQSDLKLVKSRLRSIFFESYNHVHPTRRQFYLCLFFSVFSFFFYIFRHFLARWPFSKISKHTTKSNI